MYYDGEAESLNGNVIIMEGEVEGKVEGERGRGEGGEERGEGGRVCQSVQGRLVSLWRI